jgi:hypothetical protein
MGFSQLELPLELFLYYPLSPGGMFGVQAANLIHSLFNVFVIARRDYKLAKKCKAYLFS